MLSRSTIPNVVGALGMEPSHTAREGAWEMATLITGDKLLQALGEGGFIEGGAPASVEGAKYDFRMSPIVLKSPPGIPQDISKLPENDRIQMRVDPGEVVFVRTAETLNLPRNVVAILSPKRKVSHQGIIVLGGFCIDPLYRGKLWIGLYNISSTPFPLQPGKKLIAALFYELADNELTEFKVPEAAGEADFPDDLVHLVKNYRPIEIRTLSDALAETRKKLDVLSAEFHDDKSWRRTFQENLEKQSSQIDRFLKGLEEEARQRKEEDQSIKTRLDKISTYFITARVISVIVWTVVTLFLGGLATILIQRLFASE